MREEPSVYVLRLRHRLVRDERVTTHVSLVARAFGAKGIYLVQGEEVKSRIDDVTEQWGGSFRIELVDDWKKVCRGWRGCGGLIVHLTMYGLDVDAVIDAIRDSGKDVLVVVGGAKVPGEVYRMSDYNVAIGHQPHSEVSALAVFLDRYYRGRELSLAFPNSKRKILPSARGKRICSTE